MAAVTRPGGGVMHGLAGSAALVVLSLQAVPSMRWAGLHCLVRRGFDLRQGLALVGDCRSAEVLCRLVASTHRTMTALVGIFSGALASSWWSRSAI